MKKSLKIFLLIILINFIFIFCSNVFAEEISLNISSNNALLMDYDSGKILYEKNIYEEVYPASTTKIMTAILVLENCDLKDTVTVTSSAVNNVEFGYVTGNLKPGETFTVEQMLYTLMVASANDAAYVLAEKVSRFS
ncbi:MAG: D-alanyl-D-alanine carboxypeptidase [Clostridia bacterium]|nr:D-alanyl-D-alanine carboxypeptidase [Clostridia bacterium]